MTTKVAPEPQPTLQTAEANATSAAAAAESERVGRDRTGDVLREMEELKRRQTTVERQLGIIDSDAGSADAAENVDDVDEPRPAAREAKATRAVFPCIDCELGMCERAHAAAAAAPAAKTRAPKASASR